MDNKIFKAKNNESGTLTALLSAAEVSSIHVTPVPAQAPGVIVLKPGEATEEHIYYKSRDAGAGTVSGLTRDYTNLNGGSGREHVNGSSWETMQSAEYLNNLVDALLEGYLLEQATIAYVGASSFTITGDVTAIYTAGRILRYNQDNTKIGVVASSSYNGGTGLTTITTNYGTVPASLTSVEMAIMPKAATFFGNMLVEHNQDGTHKVLVGIISPYAGATAPAGWLLADGAAVSRATYAALFAIVGTTYGVGDGSTTFNLPNLKGRVPVGKDAGQTEFAAVGQTGGEKTHQLTVAELAAHNHTDAGHGHSDSGHVHDRQVLNTGSQDGNAGYGLTVTGGYANRVMIDGGGQYTATSYANIQTGYANIQNNGSNTPHNNLQPYIALNYIIKY